MNERIKELNRQALFEVLNGQDPDKDIDKMYIPAQFTKTFAELIVRECRKVIADDIDDNSGDDFDLGLDHARQIIGEHFGVEE